MIELMVVIAIAAVLLAIAVPVRQGMSWSHDRSRCSFNLHTLGQSLLALRDDYRAFPRDLYELDYAFSILGKKPTGFGGYWEAGTNLYQDTSSSPQIDAWKDDGGTPTDRSDDTYFPGAVSLYSLYYLSAHAEGVIAGSGPVDKGWFRGGNYLRKLSFLHCPANTAVEEMPAAVNPPLLGENPGDPGYNNYDLYYRRDWFHNAPYYEEYYDEDPTNDPDGLGVRDKRNLVESPFPPADTLITFCPYHRRSQDFNRGHSGDEDLVLFADGAVMRLPAYPDDPANATAAMNPAKWFSERRAERGE